MLINEAVLKAKVPLATAFPWVRIAPDVQRAELKYLKPLLGADLYEELKTAFAGDPTDDQTELLEYVQQALGYLAVWMYLPKGNTVIEETGIKAIHQEQSKPAFEWQVKELRTDLLNSGFDGLDETIAFLLAHTAEFPSWDDTAFRKYFINSADVFSEYVGEMSGRHYLYTQLLPTMRLVEQRTIRPALGKELYDELKAEIAANNVSVNNAELLPMIRGAVAHSTWKEGLVEMAIRSDQDGVHVFDNTFARTVDSKKPVDAATLTELRRLHAERMDYYLSELVDHLEANAADYPLYVVAEESTTIENDPDGEVHIYNML